MRLFLALFLGLFFFSVTAEAQIVAVHFRDAKSADKYKKYLVEHRGERIVVGEPSKGIRYIPEKNQLTYVPDGGNELFVVNPAKPQEFAYYVQDGRKIPTSKKNRLSISGSHIKKLTILMRDETLPGLTKEYNIRAEQIEDFRTDRDLFDKSTREWQARHVRLVTAMERLKGWLESTGFPGAIKKLAKEIDRENKQVRGEAIQARGEKAKKSVKMIETPKALVDIAQEISGGKHKFHACESQHLRMLYLSSISDEQAMGALELGEQVIEGFRAEFVDPYLDDEYEDYIPDGWFHEFLFVPEDLPSYEKYTHRYYGISWTRNRDARLAMSGGSTTGGVPGGFRNFWKTTPERDLEGIICHCLGHSLASLHYGQGRRNLNQAWLTEAVGYYISFEFIGRNSVTCKAFNVDGTGYVGRKEKKIEGEKTVGEGRRDIYNEVALAEGRPIDQIALKILFELDNPDLAKSWSFYDYVVRKEGKPGQEWLRAAGRFASKRDSFIKQWRAAAAKILGVSERDAFKAIENRWREYAKGGQKSGGKRRR